MISYGLFRSSKYQGSSSAWGEREHSFAATSVEISPSTAFSPFTSSGSFGNLQFVLFEARLTEKIVLFVNIHAHYVQHMIIPGMIVLTVILFQTDMRYLIYHIAHFRCTLSNNAHPLPNPNLQWVIINRKVSF